MDTLQGQLLIASPSLLDSNFRRTVVLVTEHSDEGAAGLVLNRPSPASVSDLVPELEPLVPLLIASVFLYWSNTPAGSACSVSLTVVSTTVAASFDQVGR